MSKAPVRNLLVAVVLGAVSLNAISEALAQPAAKKKRRDRPPVELTPEADDDKASRACLWDSDCTIQFGACGSSEPIRVDRANPVRLKRIVKGPRDDCVWSALQRKVPEGRPGCREKLCVVLPK